MQTYKELSSYQQQKAREYATNKLLTAICEGVIRFNDKLNRDGLQSRIDTAFEKADKNKTPWFVHEFVMETCREDIESMAVCDAEDALYLEAGEFAVSIGALK